MPMPAPAFLPADILLPKEGSDLSRWAVLACDQFTSQPDYWEKADALVGGAPSTLRITLPEVYLEQPGVEGRIDAIHAAMKDYRAGVLSQALHGFVYVEREISSGTRQGLVGCVDLDAYDYKKGAQPRVRPSENTVEERIPPRLAVRRAASLESPHILMLCDDAQKTVIEPIAAKKAGLAPLYNFELMLGGGAVRGWAVTDEGDIAAVLAALAALEEAEGFNARYPGAKGKTSPFALAVGDGNHSLATAKAAWEQLKPGLSEAEKEHHPARFCLVELENVQSDAIAIEPIHRVVFGATGEEFLQAMGAYAKETGARPTGESGEQHFTVLYGEHQAVFGLDNAQSPLAVGSVDGIVDLLLAQKPGARVDYVHGDDAVTELAKKGAVGILLPPFEKADLFRGVALGGVLPKKTFSMGHATEKRYYLECRAI